MTWITGKVTFKVSENARFLEVQEISIPAWNRAERNFPIEFTRKCRGPINRLCTFAKSDVAGSLKSNENKTETLEEKGSGQVPGLSQPVFDSPPTHSRSFPA